MIVFENIKEIYGKRLPIIKACWGIAKESKLLPEDFKANVKATYQALKRSDEGVADYFVAKVSSLKEDIEGLEKFISKRVDLLQSVSDIART